MESWAVKAKVEKNYYMRIKKMVQAELNSSTLKGNGLIITRKVYTKENVDVTF